MSSGGKNIAELENILVEGGFLKKEELETAKETAKKEKIDLEEVLLATGHITDSQLGQLTADVNGWRYINLRNERIDEKILKLIPEKVARKQKIIVFEKTDAGMKVAMNNPEDHTIIHLLEKRLEHKVIPYFATQQDILEKFNLYKIDIKTEFANLVQQKLSEKIGETSDNSAIIRIINMLIEHGYGRNASDIHIEPNEDQTMVRLRIDGIMHDVLLAPKNIHELLATRIKVMAGLRTDEHRIPQDGKIKYSIFNEHIDVRISIVPTTEGEKIVMRLLTDRSRRFSLESLGLDNQNYQVIKKNIKKPWGMILVTGPTGSGKTTTLYAMIKLLNQREVNITTIEDPVEYNIKGITQIQVNSQVDLTFASGLRSIVRQDPDIVMVGEIRDSETADIAINSALTGHLVLSTLHTNDAATTLPRLLDMGIEPFLVASTINIAIAQRLVREICHKCIQSQEVELAELVKKVPAQIITKLAGRNPDKKHIRIYSGVGCPLCRQTGYIGRTGVFEIMEIDDSIRELIMKNANSDLIRAQAIKNGMTTMLDDAINKVLSGVTTIEEMIRIIKA